jgi:hypothetical protein
MTRQGDSTSFSACFLLERFGALYTLYTFGLGFGEEL